MIHKIIKFLDNRVSFEEVSAHCDIPCKIYDPSPAQLAALTVIRMLDLINEFEQSKNLSIEEISQLSRLVAQKEEHAQKVKEEVTVIWGDYFKQPQFEQFTNTHKLVHSIMLQASRCKQSTDKSNGIALLKQVNQFAIDFWTTKNIDTFVATSPYPPAEPVVYPWLNPHSS